MRDLVAVSAVGDEADPDIAVEVVLEHGKRTSAVEIHGVDGNVVDAALGVGSVIAVDSWTVGCWETCCFAFSEPPLLAFSFRSCSCNIYGRSNRRLLSPGHRRS